MQLRIFPIYQKNLFTVIMIIVICILEVQAVDIRLVDGTFLRNVRIVGDSLKIVTIDGERKICFGNITVIRREENQKYHYDFLYKENLGSCYGNIQDTSITICNVAGVQQYPSKMIKEIILIQDIHIMNVALRKKATASTMFEGHGPENAVDGMPNTSWASNGEAKNAWFRIDLEGTYTIVEIRLLSRSDGIVEGADKYKDMEISFTNKEKFGYTLSKSIEWQVIKLDSPIITKWVNFTIFNSYDPPWNPGFAEIELYGY